MRTILLSIILVGSLLSSCAKRVQRDPNCNIIYSNKNKNIGCGNFYAESFFGNFPVIYCNGKIIKFTENESIEINCVK